MRICVSLTAATVKVVEPVRSQQNFPPLYYKLINSSRLQHSRNKHGHVMQFFVIASASNFTKCSVYVTSRSNLNIKAYRGKPLKLGDRLDLNYEKQ